MTAAVSPLSRLRRALIIQLFAALISVR